MMQSYVWALMASKSISWNSTQESSNPERERIVRWGPRTLDLDILLYDDLILDEEDLHIPHIEMYKRDFVLKPLCQIAPYARHPVYNRTAAELLADLERLKTGDAD